MSPNEWAPQRMSFRRNELNKVQASAGKTSLTKRLQKNLHQL